MSAGTTAFRRLPGRTLVELRRLPSGRRRVEVRAQGRTVRVEVRDGGCGLDALAAAARVWARAWHREGGPEQ